MMEEYISNFQFQQQALMVLLLGMMAIWVMQTIGFFGRRGAGLSPPGPRPWPVIGNMGLLAGSSAHRNLAALAKRYNTPLLSIRLGSTPTLVACNAATARQFLRVRDSVFSDRPTFGMPDHLLFGSRNIIGFQNTSARWRELRKLWTMELLSESRVTEKRHVRHEEVARMVAVIRSEYEQPDEPHALNVLACLSHVTSNIMGRLLLSERLVDTMREPHPLHTIIEETVNLMFTQLVGDFVPFLSFLDVPTKQRMGALRQRTDRVLGSIVDRRLLLRSQGRRFDDILDILLDHTQDYVDRESLNFINGTLLEMFIAGVDTSANTMNWALAELLANPDEMRKVQEELHEVVGMGRMVDEDDLPKLKYLRATIKEVFRLHPVAVMMIPHTSNKDCEVEVLMTNGDGTSKTSSYHIPSRTRVFINLWAIGRDEHTWAQANEFKPERFMNNAIDLKGQHFELLPFGSGRRMCPGMNQGLHIVELTLANIIHCFHWCPTTSTIDLSESKSTAGSLTLATPLLVFPKFRLHMNN